MAIENGTNSFMPSRLLTQFEHDISPLMAFLGQEDDYVLYTGDGYHQFSDFWLQVNKRLPQAINQSQFKNLEFKSVQPWGWSQLIHNRYKQSSLPKSHIPVFSNGANYQQFFSRKTSLQLIEELNTQELHHFVSIPQLPQTVETIEAINDLLHLHPKGIILKTLWSSSGRGLLFIRKELHLSNGMNWIKAQIKKHGALIAEPIYNKVQDASLQFTIDRGGSYHFLGINYFDADQEGHFSKEYIHTPYEIFEQLPTDDVWILQTAQSLMKSMQALNLHHHYHGPIGVDTMFIKDINGDLRFYPLVEANIRHNMGLVNLSIKKLIASSSKGTWQITQFDKGGAVDFLEEHLQKHPVSIQNNKITKGFFPLTPFTTNTRFAAWGLVE